MNFTKNALTIALTTMLALSAVSCGNKESTDTKEKIEVNKKNVKQQAEEMSHNSDAGVVVKTEKGITVENAYATATIPGQKASAAYFVIKNKSGEDVEVTSISSNVSELTEFHTMEMKDSKMSMRKMEKVSIPAGEELVFSEGANHIMLMKLKNSLELGGDIQLNLKFNNTESLELTVPVKQKKANAMQDDHEHKDHSHEHSHKGHEHGKHNHEHSHKGHEHGEHNHEHSHEGHEHGEHNHEHSHKGHEHGDHNHEHSHEGHEHGEHDHEHSHKGHEHGEHNHEHSDEGHEHKDHSHEHKDEKSK